MQSHMLVGPQGTEGQASLVVLCNQCIQADHSRRHLLHFAKLSTEIAEDTYPYMLLSDLQT